VTSHKRATPKTSLLSRAVCRSLIFLSLCNLMSICIDAHTLKSVTAAVRKRKLIVCEAQNSICSHNKSPEKIRKEISAKIFAKKERQQF
jgi:hypothetical protein